MFSIKQLVINMSSEDRQELRKLLDEVDANAAAENAPAKEAPAPTKTKAKAAEADAPAAE